MSAADELRGPGRHVWECASDDGDAGMIHTIVGAEGSPFIAASIKRPGKRLRTTLLTPEVARRLAAELLFAADSAEGKTPLVFFPPGSATAVYPPGHPSAR